MRAAPKVRFIALAWLPLGLAAVGALLDERRSLGFTIWRAACRAAGFSPRSIAAFTLELLPLAVIGALLGGVIVLAGGFVNRRHLAHGVLAAHLGCALAMPVGLALCAGPWPLAATLVTEITLAALVTGCVLHARGAPSVTLRIGSAPRA